METTTSLRHEVKEDVWIKTTCQMCFNSCAIRVHRVNGRVVNIEGNPDCPTSQGGLCPRGASGIMLLYDPNRVNVPLKRTNPVKGIGVDPKWVEISWDEAMDTITEKLKKIKADDPRKLLGGTAILLNPVSTVHAAFGQAFGTRNFRWGHVPHCGGGFHLAAGLMYASWGKAPDPKYMNYYLNFGSSYGFGAAYLVTGMAKRMADARIRGMKHVAIEPWMGNSGMNSDEWIPIRPGTDAALALAMVNLLLNEYGICDVKSIKQYTNGPYLVGSDGYYVRDGETGKPLMWDLADGKAKTYDDPSIKDVAIEGSYPVNGANATPAFSLLKAHVKKYTPEMASQITTVPAETIRRLAKEFGEAARIGSTIVIDGKELPYRPVTVGYFKGAEGHKHSGLTTLALDILENIVGANNVPGGSLGMSSRSFGYPETGQPSWGPTEGLDGLLQMTSFGQGHLPPWPPPQPVREADKSEGFGLFELLPVLRPSPINFWKILEPEEYEIPYKPEMMIRLGGSFMTGEFNPRVYEKVMKETGIFTVVFSLFLDESAEFADMVLPDACYLERLDIRTDWMSSFSPVDEWAWHIRQPVVEPMFQRRPAGEVYLELAERLGILGDMYHAMNRAFGFKEPYTLNPAKKYTWEEIVDCGLKGYFGPEHGLDWFKENGLIHWPKKVEEVYWRPFIKGRIPMYFEYFKTLGKQIDKIKKEHGVTGFDTADYQPLPDWKPCPSYEEKRPEYDLYGIYYRVPVHTFTSTFNNPWLDEVSRKDPYIYNIAINTETAKRKGINNGDRVVIESAGTGNTVEGIATLSEAVHPEVLAYCSGGGHWAKNLPIANKQGKGINPVWLLQVGWKYLDGLSLNIDTCAKVKVTKKTQGV